MHAEPGFGVLVSQEEKARRAVVSFLTVTPLLLHCTSGGHRFGSCADWPPGQSSRIVARGAPALREGLAGWQTFVMWCYPVPLGGSPPGWASSTHGTSCFMFAQYGARCDPFICLSSLPLFFLLSLYPLGASNSGEQSR